MIEEAPTVATEAEADELPAVIYLPDQSQPLKRKRGRHFGPRPVKDPRSAWLTTRCTPEFRASVIAAAAETGLSLADYLHSRLGGQPGPRARRNPGADVVLLAKVLAQMGKSGSNLNQIAHRLNEYDFEGIPELQAMQAEHEDVVAQHRAVCEAILTALGV
jgi:hypothetical protein